MCQNEQPNATKPYKPVTQISYTGGVPAPFVHSFSQQFIISIKNVDFDSVEKAAKKFMQTKLSTKKLCKMQCVAFITIT